MKLCDRELLPNQTFPTCKKCNEVWFDMVGYNRAIERDKKLKLTNLAELQGDKAL